MTTEQVKTIISLTNIQKKIDGLNIKDTDKKHLIEHLQELVEEVRSVELNKG